MILFPGGAACQQLFPRDPRGLGLDPGPQGGGFLGAAGQVGPDRVALAEIIGDDGVWAIPTRTSPPPPAPG
jgi:hypothetical protein